MKRRIVVLGVALAMVANVASATTSPSKIDALGPGSRIHGMDISYYQHPGNSAIDFHKMYAAGIRFVIIKGGDTIDSYDAQAVKYMVPDRAAAQAPAGARGAGRGTCLRRRPAGATADRRAAFRPACLARRQRRRQRGALRPALALRHVADDQRHGRCRGGVCQPGRPARIV